ncbi:MAG: ABC transporter permease [Chloroflexi bacterium]|nr:ABC transporter permease [Chloroflexota bacterium]MDA8189541.1 ABC transporter permease [Dehalococcoidales bacterium]
MKVTLNLVVANLKEVFRNKAILFWTFVFPVIFILLFGLAFAHDDISKFNVGIVNQDQGTSGEQLAKALSSVPVFTVTNGDWDKEKTALEKGDRRILAVIRPDFTERLAKGDAELEVYYDASQPMVSQTALSVFREVVAKMVQETTRTKQPLRAVEKPIQSKHIRTIDFLVPGILGMTIMQLGLFAAIPLVSLREKKVLRRLSATPLKRSSLVVSQIIFRLLLGVIQTFIIIFVGRLVFGVQVEGNWAYLLVAVVVGAMSFLSIGFVAASFAKNEQTAEPMIQVVSMPMMFLSGVFFPIEMMPDFIQPLIKVLPLTYLNDALRQIVNQGHSIESVATDLAILGAWLVAGLAVSFKTFRWE